MRCIPRTRLPFLAGVCKLTLCVSGFVSWAGQSCCWKGHLPRSAAKFLPAAGLANLNLVNMVLHMSDQRHYIACQQSPRKGGGYEGGGGTSVALSLGWASPAVEGRTCQHQQQGFLSCWPSLDLVNIVSHMSDQVHHIACQQSPQEHSVGHSTSLSGVFCAATLLAGLHARGGGG
jgi:hypothetical protein